MMDSISPIVLRASTTILPNQKLELNTPDLQNPFRTAMLLDEVQVFVSNAGASTSDATGFLTRLRLKLGRHPLTNEFVHVPMLGKRLNDFYIDSNTQSPVYTWRLPKPLYVPATEFVVPTVFYDPSFLVQAGVSVPASLTVSVVYRGRSLSKHSPIPQTVKMPWATEYFTDALLGGSGTDPHLLESTEVNLINPFDESLRLQRFIGRHIVTSGAFIRETQAEGADRSVVDVRMVDSQNRYAIKNLTRFANVFLGTDKAWTVNTLLDPKQFFLLGYEADFSTQEGEPYFQGLVSMVGHREVAYTP
jgi:hypothetical protein